MAGKKIQKQPTFEEGLQELEKMAEQMEAGQLPLEELLKLYEAGATLSAQLEQKLQGMKAAMEEIRLGKADMESSAPEELASQTCMGDMLEGEQDL